MATVTPPAPQAALGRSTPPAARTSVTAALPAPARPPARPPIIRPERVTAPPATPKAGSRCREITLHIQLGDTLTDADRTYLRSGCR